MTNYCPGQIIQFSPTTNQNWKSCFKWIKITEITSLNTFLGKNINDSNPKYIGINESWHLYSGNVSCSKIIYENTIPGYWNCPANSCLCLYGSGYLETTLGSSFLCSFCKIILKNI